MAVGATLDIPIVEKKKRGKAKDTPPVPTEEEKKILTTQEKLTSITQELVSLTKEGNGDTKRAKKIKKLQEKYYADIERGRLTKVQRTQKKDYLKKLNAEQTLFKSMQNLLSGQSETMKEVYRNLNESKSILREGIIDLMPASVIQLYDWFKKRGRKEDKQDKKESKFWKTSEKYFKSSLKFLRGILSASAGWIFQLILFFLALAIFDPNGTLMMSIINMVFDLAMMLVNMFIRMIPTIVAMIPPIITKLVDAFIKAIPIIMIALTQVLSGLGVIIITLIDALIVALPIVIKALVQSLKILIPQVIALFIVLFPKIITALLDAAIMIFQGIVEMLPTIFLGIVKMIPVILKSLVKAIPTIINALVKAIPMIVTAFVDALPMIIDALIEALPLIIMALINAFIILAPVLFKAFNDIGKALFKGLLKLLGGIFKVLGDLLAKLVIWMGNKFSDFFKSIGNSIRNSAIGKAFDKISQIFKSIAGIGSAVANAINFDDLGARFRNTMTRLFNWLMTIQPFSWFNNQSDVEKELMGATGAGANVLQSLSTKEGRDKVLASDKGALEAMIAKLTPEQRKKFDANNDGTLTAEELVKAIDSGNKDIATALKGLQSADGGTFFSKNQAFKNFD